MLKIFSKRYDSDGPGESSCLSVWALVVLILFTVTVVVYAVYLFVRATGISNAAGVHISKNLMLAVKGAQGKLYTDEQKNIKDWIIYDDVVVGCAIKYPNDLLVSKNIDNELEFKKSSQNTDPKQSSLIYTLVIRKKNKDDFSTANDFIKKEYPEWEGELARGFYGGKEGSRTGVFKSASGIYKDVIFWEFENKIVYAESRYYSQNNDEFVKMFNKMISEISWY